MKKILSILLAVCLLAVCLPLSAAAAGTTDVTVIGAFSYLDESMLKNVNAHRAKNGKSQLKLSPELSEVARQRAAEISYYYSHTRPNGSLFSSLVSGGCGENIAVGQTSVAQVMEGWIASPGHNENLLRDGFTSMGVGIFTSGNTIFWVQTFGYAGTTSVAQQTGTATFPVSLDSFSPRLEREAFALEPGTSAQLPLVYHENSGWPDSKARLQATVSSSNTSVVQVTPSESGYRATAVGQGSCQLLYQVGNRTLSLPVTVAEHCVTLDTGDFTMMAGLNQTIKATTVPEGLPVAWTSSDTNVATVSSNGAVYGRKAGTATITATANNNGTYYTASCVVTVTPNQVGFFILPQDSVEMEVGDTYSMDITIEPITTVLSFSYEPVNIVSARDWKEGDTRGITITGLRAGTTVVTVSSFSNTATCKVTVYPKGQKPGGSPTPDPEVPQQKYTVDFINPLNMLTISSKEVVNGQPYGTLPTPTMPGYTFEGWYSDSTFTQQITEDTIVQLTGDQRLYAKMTPEKRVAVTFKNMIGGVTNIDPAGGKLLATLSAPAGRKWTEWSLRIYTTSGSLIGTRGETGNVTTSGQDYPLGIDLTLLSGGTVTDGMILDFEDFRLTAGTVYEVEFTAVVDGTTYRSGRAQFRLTAAPAFTDVTNPSAYYYDPVRWAVMDGITKGTSDTTFSPNDPCERGHIVTFLWRASGSPKPSSSYNPFMDVKPGDYYYDAVLWAQEKGITVGTDSTHFSPHDPCTRGQAVTFLWRANGSPASTGTTFADVAAGAFYADAVRWAVKNGITSGKTPTAFSPSETCTRGQIVTFLYRSKQ